MSNDELLQSLADLVEQYAKHRSFIEKASEQAEKFSEVVVHRVVEDNRKKMKGLEEVVVPMIGQASTACLDLEARRDKVQADVSDSQLVLEELQLRAAIGELDDDAFESQSAEVKGVVDSADSNITGLEEELERLRALLSRWQELSGTPVEQEAVSVESEPVDNEPETPMSEGPVSLGEVELDEPDATHSQGVLLVYEGTPQEQTLTIGDVSLTVGRGRNNSFQIKDDSKVSRMHTTFMRQGDAYVIRDGVEKGSGWKASANGTQVNGQLVTEATLVGGEEITIGETHFRFQIVS